MPDLNLKNMRTNLKAKHAERKKTKRSWRVNQSTVRVFASAFVIFAFLFTHFYSKSWGENADRLAELSSTDFFESIDLETLEGDRFTAENLKDAQITLFNVWGTSCAPCIMEMPDLEELNNSYEGKIQIIGVVSDITDENGNLIPKKAEEAKQILAKAGVTFPSLITDKNAYAFFTSNVIGTPTTFFVDQDGDIIKTVTGRNTLSQWKKKIDGALATQ